MANPIVKYAVLQETTILTEDEDQLATPDLKTKRYQRIVRNQGAISKSGHNN